MQARFTSVVAVIVLLASPGLCGRTWAQATAGRSPALSHETGPAGPYAMTGQLERRAERFALVDEEGNLEAYLIPRVVGPGQLRGKERDIECARAALASGRRAARVG